MEPQTIAIVGATQGMGAAAARILAARGHRLVVSGRSLDSLGPLLAELGPSGRGHPLDHGDRASVEAFFAWAGPLDHLLLVGAPPPARGRFSDLTPEAFLAGIEGKTVGFYRCLKAALPFLRPDGSVTFVTGGAARSAVPGTLGVAAANGALHALAPVLAKELAPLRVNVVAPGMVDTPAHGWMDPEARQALFTRFGQASPLGRVGRPEDVAEALAYLVEAGYVTGALLDVDGGFRWH